MVRVITQDTFDSVVKENIEDLEMGRKEAVEDAREQFVAQVRQRKSCLSVRPSKWYFERALSFLPRVLT